MFSMPCRKTLISTLQKIPLDTGISPTIMNFLNAQAKNMTDTREKICILMWDEVSLDCHLTYDPVADKIVGFEDWGNRRTSNYADHALVFMLRGLLTGWKIPINYCFCDSQTKTQQLISCIKETVRAVTAAGFTIVATVCDQGSSNVAAINKMLKRGVQRKCYSSTVISQHCSRYSMSN